MYKTSLLLILFFLSAEVYCRNAEEKWVQVSKDNGQTTSINVDGLPAFKGNDFFVWSLQELNSPLTMEEVDGDIYKIRTYYHINKDSKRYSIIEVIFYDKEGNVLKGYNYNRNSDNPEFIFSNPVIPGSEIEKIIKKCLEVMAE